MNDQTGIGAPVFYGPENLIERHDNEIEFSKKKLKRKERTRHLARHGDHRIAQRLAKSDMRIWDLGIGLRHSSDKNWPVAIAHARSAVEQRITPGYIRVRVE